MIPRDEGDDCSSATMIPASMKVLDAGLISDHTVGLCEERSPQPDPIADSQPLASAIEGQNRERDSATADLEASTSALSIPPLLEVSGQIENPSTWEDKSVLAAVGEHKASDGGDNGKSSIFVARSRDTLEKVLRDCDLHHLPLLTWFRRSPELQELPIQPISNEPILPHPSSWQLVGDGSTELAKKGCLASVIIHAPRKGVLVLEPSSICHCRVTATPVPARPTIKLNKKKRKQKTKGVRKTMSAPLGSTQPPNTTEDLPEPRSQSCSSRVPIGILTSGSVRGSTSSAAIGICEVAAFGVLKGKQMTPDQKHPSSEILVLACNASSSMYRPALASIATENEDIDV